ncbi:hypothetical protein L3Q82_015263 [Scortum barcoo]|uniref:Uncharacterized protein n=1 Tax=Scortum barcoo TaxID=214431 RepID=A0ACB8VTZ7_9TELE|nr:hypothetical protein L3Q82_015263 [Scortum barcoo]
MRLSTMFSLRGFIMGAQGYKKTDKERWQLLNFLTGEAKMAIYVSRKNRVENREGQDAKSGSNTEKPSNMIIPIIAAVAVLAVVLMAAAGFILYKKKKGIKKGSFNFLECSDVFISVPTMKATKQKDFVMMMTEKCKRQKPKALHMLLTTALSSLRELNPGNLIFKLILHSE